MAWYTATAIATGAALLAVSAVSCTLDTEGGLQAGGELDASAEQGGQPDVSSDETSIVDVSHPDAPEAKDGPGKDAPPDVAEASNEDGEAGCTPETDGELCDKYGKNCMTLVVTDRCGMQRQADCGACLGSETCGGGGVPNVCGSWWSCEWSRRMQVAVQTTGELLPDYSVNVTLDHAALVSAGLSLASGQDVRVLHRDQLGAWTEIDRVLDPVSSWNHAQTTIWFRTTAFLSANGTDSGYFVYFGNPGAGPAPADEGKVFHFADLFDRPDAADVGNGWTVMEEGGTNINIAGGAMWFETTADYNNRPVAEHAFAPVSSHLALRLGFNWSRTGEEGLYRVHMQLGQVSSMDNPPAQQDVWSVAGVGPSLLWAGPNHGMSSHEGLGYAIGNVGKQLMPAKGKLDVEARASIESHDFQLSAGGVQAVGLAFSTEVPALDRVRLFTWQVNQVNFVSRGFDYVIVRTLVEPEPVITASAAESSSCQ